MGVHAISRIWARDCIPVQIATWHITSRLWPLQLRCIWTKEKSALLFRRPGHGPSLYRASSLLQDAVRCATMCMLPSPTLTCVPFGVEPVRLMHTCRSYTHGSGRSRRRFARSSPGFVRGRHSPRGFPKERWRSSCISRTCLWNRSGPTAGTRSTFIEG